MIMTHSFIFYLSMHPPLPMRGCICNPFILYHLYLADSLNETSYFQSFCLLASTVSVKVATAS